MNKQRLIYRIRSLKKVEGRVKIIVPSYEVVKAVYEFVTEDFPGIKIQRQFSRFDAYGNTFEISVLDGEISMEDYICMYFSGLQAPVFIIDSDILDLPPADCKMLLVFLQDRVRSKNQDERLNLIFV